VNDQVISAEVRGLLYESLGRKQPAQSATGPTSVPASPPLTPSR
jgi:hypothetical protein